MNRTKIKWVKNPDGSQGYTINPVKGLCPMACSYCYARKMYKRFKWNPRLRYDPSAWLGLGSLRKPSRIFVGSTIELFHDSLSPQYLKWIFEVPLEFPQHTFIVLTKQPQNLIEFSPFPENCWVGVTVLNDAQLLLAETQFEKIKASVKFLSLEPLKNQLDAIKYMKQPNWIICGQQTPVSAKTEPKVEWVREIVDAADRAGIPVFLKDNLKPLLCSIFHGQEVIESHNLWAFREFKLRQEMPK